MIDQLRENMDKSDSRNREPKAITLEDLKIQNSQRLARETENRRKRAMKKLALKQQQQQDLNPFPESHGYRSSAKHHTPNHSVSSRSSSNSLHQHKGEAHKYYSNVHSPSSSLGYHKAPQKAALPHALTVQELKEMTRARLASESTKCTETASYSSYDSSSVTSSLNQSRRQIVSSHQPIRRRMNDTHRSTESRPHSNLAHSQAEVASKRSNSSRFFQDFSCCSHHSIDAIDNTSVSSFVSGISESHTHVSDVSGRNHRMMSTHVDLGRAISEDVSDCSDYTFHYAPVEAAYKYASPSSLRNLHEDRPLSADKGGLVTSFTGEHFFGTRLSGSNQNSDFQSLEIKPSHISMSLHGRFMADKLRQSIQTSSTVSLSSGMSYDSHPFNRDISANIYNTDPVDECYLDPRMHSLNRPSSGNGDLPNSVAESVLGPSDLNTDLYEAFTSSSGSSRLLNHDDNSTRNGLQADNYDMSQLTLKWSETLKLYDELHTESPPQHRNNMKHTYGEYD